VDDSARDDGEIFEATVFLHHFNDLTDTRQQAKVVYPLDEVLLLALLAALAGAETFICAMPARSADQRGQLSHRHRAIPGADVTARRRRRDG
jgi:hypothetical protein